MFKQMIAVAAIASALAGCGDAAQIDGIDSRPDATSSTTTTSPGGSTGGFGSPSQAPGEFALQGSGRAVSGALRLHTNGCWYVDFDESTHLAVFPVGFEIPFADDTTIIVGPDGERYSSGTAIDGAVHEVRIGDLPGGPDGRWANYVAFCDPADISIAVFDTMEPAFDPLALTDDEVEELIGAAVFSKAWPCGRGWAVSTEDEVVGLFLYQMTSDELPAGATISLPNEGWLAQVVVGKHLFVNHCDDVVEAWEPDAVIAREWPLSGGTLEIKDPFPRDPESSTVRAVLLDAQLETPAGSQIRIPRVELVNRSFNAFAG